MKNILIINILFLFISCSNKEEVYRKQAGFVEQAGLYRFPTTNLKLSELTNGTLIFAVEDKNQNLLFQNSLFRAFNKFQKWAIYVDEFENYWFRSSDLQITDVWIKSNGNYIKHDYSLENISPPSEFLK